MDEAQRHLCKEWRGKPWPQARDAGALPHILEAYGGRVSTMCRGMRWDRTGGLRDACRDLKPRLDAVRGLPQPVKLLGDLAQQVYGICSARTEHPLTVAQISEQVDRSERSVLAAVDEIRAASYDVAMSDGGTVSVRRQAGNSQTHYTHPGWGEQRLLFGVVADTHLGNLCACEDELAAAYDLFAAEGVMAVLHCGDIMDGPGNQGFAGHRNEVREDCQTRYQQVAWASAHYPVREGLTTYLIDSSKSHGGWEYTRTGWHMARALVDGFAYHRNGPEGEDPVIVPGRPDMRWLDWDESSLWVGPEARTEIRLLHPDGGSAYAISYQPQQWANALEGGTKPHVAIFGHYHKAMHLPYRGIHLIQAGCQCWQTPFMRRKRLAAVVGFYLLELRVDADGDVRRCRPEFVPQYRPRTKHHTLEVA
jgi:hypothetical protein